MKERVTLSPTEPPGYRAKPDGWECDRAWCWFRENRGTWDGEPRRR